MKTDMLERSSRVCLADMLGQHASCPVDAQDLVSIVAGASGRYLMRAPQVPGLVGVFWTPQRADNASFLPACKGLAAAGVRVPALMAARDLSAELGEGAGACLVEDLGTQDILSLKDEPWPMRRVAYQAAFETLAPLYRLTPDWPLQPPFDAALYRWEQEYFAEHFLGTHCGLPDAANLAEHEGFVELAEKLAALPRVPVHRDCQSQNIMLRDGQAWLIDFQGMRLGLPEYDLASLVYDAYMELQSAEVNELLPLWTQVTGLAWSQELFEACAMQRLMQALGAFANLGHNFGKTWYINKIPAGIENLKNLARSIPAGHLAHPAAQHLLTQLPS